MLERLFLLIKFIVYICFCAIGYFIMIIFPIWLVIWLLTGWNYYDWFDDAIDFIYW